MKYHYISFHFQLFERLAGITQEASLLALHSPKSHTEAIMCVLQVVTFVEKEKKNGVQRRTKVGP